MLHKIRITRNISALPNECTMLEIIAEKKIFCVQDKVRIFFKDRLND